LQVVATLTRRALQQRGGGERGSYATEFARCGGRCDGGGGRGGTGRGAGRSGRSGNQHRLRLSAIGGAALRAGTAFQALARGRGRAGSGSRSRYGGRERRSWSGGSRA
jgi:hypothetical protein